MASGSTSGLARAARETPRIEALGWRWSRRLPGRIPFFAARRVVAAWLSGPRLGSRVLEPDFHWVALAVIGEDFRAFCGGVFCKSQDRKPSMACGRNPCAHELRAKRHRNSSEGRGRIRNEGGERRGARLPRGAGFFQPHAHYGDRQMDNAKPFPGDVLHIGAPPATERCFGVGESHIDFACHIQSSGF
jgi:hypothetical protein